MNKFCTNCGHPLKPNTDFCPECGKKVDQIEYSQPSRQIYKDQTHPKTDYKKIIAVIGIVVAVIASGATYYFVTNQNSIQETTAKITGHSTNPSQSMSKRVSKLKVSSLTMQQKNAAVMVYAAMKYKDRNWQHLIENSQSHKVDAINEHPQVIIDAENNRNGLTDYSIQPDGAYRIFSYRSTLGETTIDEMVEYINNHNYENMVNQLSENIRLKEDND